MTEEIRKIGIVGAGTMGSGIARLFALHDYPVVLADRSAEILSRTLARLRERSAAEGQEKVATLVRTASTLAEMTDCDLVIEAVNEDAAVKDEVFARLGVICRPGTIFATNTSALSIDRLARTLPDPARFIGMHFMNPPVTMRLVEVVQGDRTAPETVAAVVALARRLDKVPVVVRDAPGFVANRLLFALIGEALRLLEDGIAGRDEIDAVVHYGLNHPMGPLALADFIGLDICRQIMNHLCAELGDERYRPTRTLEELVAAGKLGKKSGEGFYRYH